ncbi:LysM peptidoglycan-binding domain-containing protein [Carboxylicivirga mesophila]|uniref:LysM peptidoglycan-binding domain-containing protein n=1 Tax=Carboxylicivirga mesophila TaxID=1166478 RepID=A0ABS5KE29_9BACT|nr:LysM peptidoglycan-binding domain-containing protein [Carboxylicivirga mesophila]MBS2213236.1 LysM peptidoglycan-binding domain-containing protein [Carboxylicivirga mesophila]
MKKIIILLNLFIALFTISESGMLAQEGIPQGTEKIIIDGQEYYLHKVRKSEGLYRISVSYGVSQKEILEVNPSAALGLKEGQLIKVPVIKGRNSTEEQLNTGQYIYHTVEKGQTAYYISKRYKVDLQDIYENNPGSNQQLLVGAMIKIPKKDVVKHDHSAIEEGYHLHKVAPKETLYAIGRKYDVDIRDIIKHNKGLESGILSVGSYVRVPVKKADEEKVVEPQLVDGSEDAIYIYHKIKSGETLYSISEKYNARSQDVIVANSSINANDLPLGYLVRIPKASIRQAKKQDPFKDAVLIDHKIRKRESLYDVEKTYGVPAELIEKVNTSSGIDLNDWRKGMIIKVPSKKWVEDYYESIRIVETDEAESGTEDTFAFEKQACDTYDYSISKPSIAVAVLLPFNFEATNAINYTFEEVDGDTIQVENEKRKLSNRSKVFVEFYQGTLLALDALKKEGVNVDLFVYDTAPDSNKVKQILNKPELRHADLIIGPAYSSNLKLVSDFSRVNNIPMVYPLSTSNSELENNPLLFQANAPDTLMIDIMAQKMIQQSMGKRLVMIRTESKDNVFEQKLSQLIRDKVYWESFKNGQVPDFVEYNFKQDDLVSMERMFANDKENAVIIPSMEEAQVNRIITTVKGAADKTKTPVTLWGLPEWMKYNTINPEDIHKLNGHIFSYYAVDYTDTINNERINTYRSWFGTEPMAISPFFQTASVNSNLSRYSLWGHDVTYYFVTALRNYGANFTHCIQHHQPHTIQSKLDFVRMANWGGFFNRGLYVVKFNPDYEVTIEEVE